MRKENASKFVAKFDRENMSCSKIRIFYANSFKYVKQKGASYKKRFMSRAFKIEKMIPERK